MRRNVRRALVAMLLVLPVLLTQPLAAPAAGSGRATAAKPAPGRAASARSIVTAPTAGALYTDGPDGRYLLGGTWLFRLDPTDAGVRERFPSSGSATGWSPVTVPNAWNATDQSDASMNGSIGWYRRDFTLPNASASLAWIVRFESVNFHAEVWLNGRPLGTNTGAYLPFEFPLAHLNRTGVNRLVIRVDNRLVNNPVAPQPPYGWWNYGGLLGEVYLRRVDRVDFAQVAVRPTIACRTCRAQISDEATIHNYSGVAQVVHVTGVYGPLQLDLGQQTVAAGQDAVFSAGGSFAHPRLWSPSHPNLYTARLVATAAAAGSSGANQSPTHAAGYTVLSGVRSIRVDSAGRLLLNGIAIRFRGVAIHEDNPVRGGALDNAERAQIIALTHDVGATLIRAHHPLHPELEELADRTGILLWSEIPMYQLSESELGRSAYTSYGRAELQSNILTNQNHPSVAIWSIANELPTTPGPNQIAYIDAQAALAKQLDPTRPVGQAVAVNPHRRLPGAGLRAARRPRSQRLLRLVHGSTGVDRRPGPAVRVSRLDARVLPPQGAGDHGVRRGGQPPRPGRGEGDVCVPIRLRQVPSRRLPVQAVARRRDLLHAAGVPRRTGLGRGRSTAGSADPPKGPDLVRRLQEAGLLRRAPDVPRHGAARRARRRRRLGVAPQRPTDMAAPDDRWPAPSPSGSVAVIPAPRRARRQAVRVGDRAGRGFADRPSLALRQQLGEPAGLTQTNPGRNRVRQGQSTLGQSRRTGRPAPVVAPAVVRALIRRLPARRISAIPQRRQNQHSHAGESDEMDPSDHQQ